jgi:hypothetical protein
VALFSERREYNTDSVKFGKVVIEINHDAKNPRGGGKIAFAGFLQYCQRENRSAYVLHISAVKAQLTWPRDHIFEHTEIKSQLEILQQEHIEVRDAFNGFRYYLDFIITRKMVEFSLLDDLKNHLTLFCRAAYGQNRSALEISKLKYSIDHLRLALKSDRTALDHQDWMKLIDNLLHQLDHYESSIKSQLLHGY